MRIDITKPVRTKTGRKVTIINYIRGDISPIIGTVEGVTEQVCWTENGGDLIDSPCANTDIENYEEEEEKEMPKLDITKPMQTRDEEIARLKTQIEYQRSIFDDINFKLNEAMQSKEVILKEKNDILDKLRKIIE